MRKELERHPKKANADEESYVLPCGLGRLIKRQYNHFAAIAQRLRRLSKDVFDSFACRLRMICLLFQQFC